MTQRPVRDRQAVASGRHAAWLAVADVLAGRGFVAERLASIRRGGALDPREIALATDVGLGAVRHAITLEHVLSAVARYEPRRTPRVLRALLLTAAYQMIWSDRVPLFAAVDESVELARIHQGRRAAGMVNAVLRRLSDSVEQRRGPWRERARDQVRVAWDQACIFKRPVLPAAPEDEATADPAAATGQRAAYFERLSARWGADTALAVSWVSQAIPPIVLQRNELRVREAEFEQSIREQLAGAEIGRGPGSPEAGTASCAFLPPSTHLADAPLFVRGGAFVQDLTARLAADRVAARPGERVLDLCAAPGGKSIVLAMHMHDQGEVIACDTSESRLNLVRQNAERLGVTSIRFVQLGGTPLSPASLGGPVDAALVDVPCSNTGVFARRPEARLGFSPAKLDSLARLQAQLLRTAADCVRPGGRLVYSTCSIEPEENEQLVEGFLSDSGGWLLEGQQTTLPAWGPRISDWCDGGYVANLVRGK